MDESNAQTRSARFAIGALQRAVAGLGWNRPADASDPENAAKNRRVEVKVYPLESQ